MPAKNTSPSLFRPCVRDDGLGVQLASGARLGVASRVQIRAILTRHIQIANLSETKAHSTTRA